VVCRGDPKRTCGGGWRNKVFKIKLTPPKAEEKKEDK
jgi:hypothetical protein